MEKNAVSNDGQRTESRSRNTNEGSLPESMPRKKRTRRTKQEMEEYIDSSEAPIERRVILKLMNEKGLDFDQLYSLVDAYGKNIQKEDPSFEDEMVTHFGLRQMLTRAKAIPQSIFTKLIGILGYQMILAPVEADVKISFQNTEIEIPQNLQKDSIKVISLKKEISPVFTEDAAIRISEIVKFTRHDLELPRKVRFRTYKIQRTEGE